MKFAKIVKINLRELNLVNTAIRVEIQIKRFIASNTKNEMLLVAE